MHRQIVYIGSGNLTTTLNIVLCIKIKFFEAPTCTNCNGICTYGSLCVFCGLRKCNIGIVWLVGGLEYSLKPLVRPHVLILTVGDTPSTDDQVFVCQLGSAIEDRCSARITISYVFALFYGYWCNWYRCQRSTWSRSTNCCQRPIH